MQMKTIRGKYSPVRIMIDEVEDTALVQIQAIADHPAMENSNIVIMPDCHAGAGCVIGFTQDISENDYLIPNLIGVDIGCGVLSIKLGSIDIDLKKLDCFIKTAIPHGFAHRKQTHKLALDEDFTHYADIEGGSIKKQVGTLGSGNHFIEVGIASDDDKWLFIHCGSRNFGKRIADFYQHLARKNCEENSIDVPKGTEFLPKSDTAYGKYLHDLKVAQNMAALNRKAIAADILDYLNAKAVSSFDTVHNYILNDIVRKGAIAAYEDTCCVIPFNMRDGAAICRGKGNKDWNYSAPHGAGRVLSRNKARKAINAEDVKNEMAANGIFSTTAHLATDEAPQAYKSKDTIIDAIAETVDIVDFVRPIYNFKSY
jgi:RNA-splicing ligase RtcB